MHAQRLTRFNPILSATLIALGMSLIPAGATAEVADHPEEAIPEIIKQAAFLPEENNASWLNDATYTLVANHIPVREVLISLARKAHLAVDLAPDIQGNVTLNISNQSLPALLERIAQQSNIRFQVNNRLLSVQSQPLPLDHVIAPVDQITRLDGRHQE